MKKIFLNSNNLNLNDSLILVKSSKEIFLNSEKISKKKNFFYSKLSNNN